MLDLEEVRAFAEMKHQGQLRKNGAPYIVHPIRVSEIIREVEAGNKHHDILIAASLLHDTLEDTETSYKELEERFGFMTAGLVSEVTSSPTAVAYYGKAKYFNNKLLGMTPQALSIKLADRLDNLWDMECFTEEDQKRYFDGTIENMDYITKNRELTPVHRQLIARIREGPRTVLKQPRTFDLQDLKDK